MNCVSIRMVKMLMLRLVTGASLKRINQSSLDPCYLEASKNLSRLSSYSPEMIASFTIAS